MILVNPNWKSDWIRFIRFNPNESCRFHQLTFNPNESRLSESIRMITKNAGSIRLTGFIRIVSSDWSWSSRINFEAVFNKRDSKRFSDWFGLTRIQISEWFEIVLIGSEWIPIRNFRQIDNYLFLTLLAEFRFLFVQDLISFFE